MGQVCDSFKVYHRISGRQRIHRSLQIGEYGRLESGILFCLKSSLLILGMQSLSERHLHLRACNSCADHPARLPPPFSMTNITGREKVLKGVDSLFLAALLDALLTSVHRALAGGLLGHLLTSLLVCGCALEHVVASAHFRDHTGGLLQLESLILIVLVDLLLLWLLVVDWVGTRCVVFSLCRN